MTFGLDKLPFYIALSFFNLGRAYHRSGELEKALEMHEKSLEMKRAIHGQNKPHPDTAISLFNIGLVHQLRKNINQATEFLEQSLVMLRIVHGRNSLHPDIAGVRSHLGDVLEDQGRRNEAFHIREGNTETDESSA